MITLSDVNLFSFILLPHQGRIYQVGGLRPTNHTACKSLGGSVYKINELSMQVQEQ